MKIATIIFSITIFIVAGPAMAQSDSSASKRTNKSFAKPATQSAEVQKRKFQVAYRKKLRRSFPLASISVSEDCSAETTCPNGTTLQCSIEGPSTSCNSDASGVACFKENDDGSVTGSSGTC